MKKKLFLITVMVMIFACLLALSISALEIDYNEKATLSDGTVLPIYDENQNPLIWFIKDENATGMDKYASVATNRNTADNASSYVTFNINSTYGENQLHDVYINYWDAETSAYVSYGEGTQVVCNYRGLSYYCIGTFADGSVIEYLYHSPSVKDAGKLHSYSKLQLLDFSLATNYTGFSEQAFKNCSALREVRFGVSESGYSLTCQNGNLFGGCTSLTTLKFADPSKIIGLQDGVFKNLTALKDISFVNDLNITTLPKDLFNGCSALTGTYEFTKITEVKEYAFRYAGTAEDSYLVLKFPKIVSIGGSTTDCYTFGNSGIREVYLGSKLSSMQLRTFDSSQKLIKVEMDGTSMTYIPMLTFYNCTALKAFSVPEGIKSLESYVFSKCTSLKAVYLPSTLTAINSGSQESSTFYNCYEMYFVAEAFTFTGDNDIPAKPDVYFFPENLATMSGETFKVCKSLNKTLVFPKKITSVANSWFFEAATSSVTLENIVFLGDMTDVTTTGGTGAYWDFKGKIYFCNSADKSLSDVNMGTYKDKAVFCFAEGNTTHLANPNETIVDEATCTTNRAQTTYCFCTQLIGTTEVENTALGHNFDTENGAKLTAIVYEDFAKIGKYVTTCSRCVETHEDESAPALFEYRGYSTDGAGEICVGYNLDKQAIANYRAVNNGAVLEFGMVAAAIDYIGGASNPLNNDATQAATNVIKADISNADVNAVDFKVVGDFATYSDLNLALSMYVYDGNNVKYVYANGDEEAGCYADAKIINYNMF